MPTVNRSDRNEQYFFINNRAASAPVINYALREGYHTLLPGNRHPSVFLFIDMDPALVDVNVHPTKTEVRFYNAQLVHSQIRSCVRECLLAVDMHTGGSLPVTQSDTVPSPQL